MFKATEFDLEKGERTGVVEFYGAETVEAAVRSVFYTRSLSNGKTMIGPTNRVVYSGNRAYVVTEEELS